MKKSLITILLFSILHYAVQAQKNIQQNILSSPCSFHENKGQLMDENHKPLNDIPFYGRQGSVNVYCMAGKISFIFTKTETEKRVSEVTGKSPESGFAKLDKKGFKKKNTKIIANRAELQFLNANRNTEIIATDQQEYNENYYTTGNANHGIINIHTYKTITYNNIYPHINLILYMRANGIKYEFIVNPGGRIKDIQLKWNGLQNIKLLENNGISYSLPLGKFTESAPLSYQQSATNQKQLIPSSFIRNGSRVSFSVKNYDKKQPLVIDPIIDWGTYYGDADNQSTGVAVDDSGHIYITGWTGEGLAIATNGAYQTSYGGSDDAFLAKFNSSGVLLWGTYYGGDDVDQAYAVTTDHFGNVFITGTTYSSNGIAFGSTYQDYLYTQGAGNTFLAKFNGKGVIQWGTYYGGENEDEGYALATDTSGNIYMTGNTSSTFNIATNGSFQSQYGGGSAGDAFLAKFTKNGSLSWGTYFGKGSGFSSQIGQGVAVSKKGQIYITGLTNMGSGVATKGAYQTSLFGGQNAFIAQFNTGGGLNWATYYGGGSDNGNGAATDVAGNAYIIGQTGSTAGIATTGAFQTSLSGSIDAFLVKFSASGVLQWGTYFGGNKGGNGTGVSTDTSGNVFITGDTYSDSGIAVPGAYQTSYAGDGDAFIARFNGNGERIWASYYGGGGNDNATGISNDNSGNIYVTGYTNGASGITTKGSHQYRFEGDTTFTNAFLAEFPTPSTISGLKSESNIPYFNFNIFPNPFTSQTAITYQLSLPSHIRIEVSDMQGRATAVLADENQLPGDYITTLSADKYHITKGAYFIRIFIDGQPATKTIIKIN